MTGSQTIFLISAGCIFGGAVFGLLLSRLLPEAHLRDNSRDTVKVVTGLHRNPGRPGPGAAH